MKKVILDTDIANEADDYFALVYLLKNRDLFDIKAITIAPFRTDVYQKNVSDSIDDSYNAACTIFDYLNINNKSIIYKGSKNYRSEDLRELYYRFMQKNYMRFDEVTKEKGAYYDRGSKRVRINLEDYGCMKTKVGEYNSDNYLFVLKPIEVTGR